MSHSSHEYVSIILDEIALEGLDGITLQALWLRLSLRPGLCVHFDDSAKVYIWNLAKKLKDVEMFELSIPRKDLATYDRFEHLDPETGTVVDPENIPEEIYPYAPVEDVVHGIRGSSSTYHDQVNVSEVARTLTYGEVNDRWGNKLILVASQSIRMYAIQGDNVDPNVELTLQQYCLLEKIGRSRYHGEITIGKSSLQRIGIDSKTLFYVRKYLMLHKLITKQIFHLKSSSQNCSGSLLHLTRFFVLRRPKVLILTEKVVEILKSRPGNFAEYEEIRQIFGLYYSLKKLMKTTEFQKFTKCEMLPYRTVYPEANRSEWKLKAFDQEKMVRVIQLIKPDIDVEEIWSKEEGYEEEDSYSGYLDQSKLVLDRPVLCQAYDFFESAGPKGISQVEVGIILGQSKLEARNICRNLVKCGLVSMYLQDVGRQRVRRYVCNKFSNQGEMNRQYEREKQKMFELLSLKTEPEVTPEDQDSKNDLNTSSGDPDLKNDTQIKVENEKLLENKVSCIPGMLPMIKAEACGESIVTEVVEDSVETSITNKYTGFQDLMTNDWQHRKESMTYRLLKRANLIMECVKANKVIYDCKKLLQFISDEEEREGYNVKICKKSFLRILSSLKKDGCVKTISITLRMKNKTRDLAFICEPSITKDDPVIQSAVEQAKVKFFVHQKATLNAGYRKSASNKDKASKDKKKDGACKEEKEKIVLIKGMGFGKKYGFRPKFIRMKILHRLLFYLIYSYEGDEDLQQQKSIDQMMLAGYEMSEEVTKELPTIYYPTLCWKTFIPPLPSHLGFPDGWTFMSDWLLRIPLSLFVQLLNITYAVPSLEEYLNHPVRQHYLVRSLPSKIRKYLLLGRRYIFNIHDVVCRLCYIGLLQFGPQRLKDKDQVFIYLNRKAFLLDTTPSRAGYHQVSDDIEYEQQNYIFASMSDVDKYWYDMWGICLKTQLGGRMCVTGDNITLEVLEAKEAMIEATQPKNPDEAPSLDIGYIPGDHRGAAGLDSAMFSHLKRNWNKSNLNMKPYSDKPEPPAEANIRETKLKQGKDKPYVFQQVTNVKVGKVNKTYAKVSGLQRKRAILTTVQNLCKKKVEKAKHVVRKVLPKRNPRRPRPYYDEEDRKALAAMSKLRVDWTEVEDSLLLTCKVAGLYFFPNPKYLSMSFQAIRDVLHSTIKESRNKTSRACQRRILYVMRNPATAHSVSLSLLDLKHDLSITQKFQGVIQRAKAVAKNKEQLEKLLRPAFAELVLILSKKSQSTSKPNVDHELKVSDVKDLRSKYDIAFPHILESKTRFHDVKNVSDVKMAALHAIIHSSFCCSADKTSYAYQLFKVYQQYPDNFLKAAMNKFRTDQMVTLKKIYSRSKYKSGNFLPVSSCPYQLSMTYAYLFQTEYQFEIFQQAYSIMKALNHQLPLCSEDEKVEVMTSDGGTAALITEYFSTNKITLHVGIPDQVIILDPVFAQRKDTYEGILKRFSQLLEATYRDKMGIDIPFNPLVGCGKRKRPNDGVDKDNPVKRIKVDQFHAVSNIKAESKDVTSTESPSSKSAEQQASGSEELDVATSGSEALEVATSGSCTVKNTEGTGRKDKVDETNGEDSKDSSAAVDENQVENKLLANNAACAASRIALYLMRKELTDSPLINSHHAHDFFVVNACDVYCQAADLKMISEAYKAQLKLSETVIQNIKSSLILPNNYTSLLDLRRKYMDKGATNLDWNYVCKIINFVAHAKEVGVTTGDLKEKLVAKVGSFPLSWHLSVLAKERVFVRVGVTVVRYVHYEYVTPWIVNSSKLFRLQRENFIPTEVKVMSLNKGTKSPKKTILENEEEEAEEETNDASHLESATGKEFKDNKNEEHLEQVLPSNSTSVSSSHEGDPLSVPSAKRSRVKLPKCTDDTEESVTNRNSMEWNSPANKIKVFIRPWVRVDGSLNRRVLDRFLGAVLGHTLQNPGICMKDLCNRFIPALQPYHTREIVEILRDLQCVKLGALKMKKPTLFSKPSKVEIVTPDGTEDESKVLVSPLINAVSNLGIYLGDKKYTVDFLGNIL